MGARSAELGLEGAEERGEGVRRAEPHEHQGEGGEHHHPAARLPVQVSAPRAVIGQSASTTPPRTQTYQSWRLMVGSQCPGTSSSFSPKAGAAAPAATSTKPCSSDAWT